jgi:hypothetical protein
LYSASNFVLAVALARALSAPAFGRAAAGLALLSLLVLLGRHLVLEPMLVGYAGASRQHFAGRVDASTLMLLGTALAVMLLAGATVAPEGWALAALAPVVLVQDHLRYRSFAVGRPGDAIAADVLVLAATAPLPFVSADLTVLCGWFAAALVGSSVGMLVLGRRRPRRPTTVDGVPELPLRALLTEFALVEVPAALLVVLLAVRSATEAAAFRVILIPYGLFWVIVGGIRSLGLAGQHGADVHHRLQTARRFGQAAAVVALAIAVTTVLVPADLWRDALGQQWPSGFVMLLTTATLHMLRGVGAGEILFLRGIREARSVGRARSVGSMLSWPVAALAIVLADAELLMLALLLAEAVVLLRLWPLSSRIVAHGGADGGVGGLGS